MFSQAIHRKIVSALTFNSVLSVRLNIANVNEISSLLFNRNKLYINFLTDFYVVFTAPSYLLFDVTAWPFSSCESASCATFYCEYCNLKTQHHV